MTKKKRLSEKYVTEVSYYASKEITLDKLQRLLKYFIAGH